MRQVSFMLGYVVGKESTCIAVAQVNLDNDSLVGGAAADLAPG
jgi:hypothetical protein